MRNLLGPLGTEERDARTFLMAWKRYLTASLAAMHVQLGAQLCLQARRFAHFLSLHSNYPHLTAQEIGLEIGRMGKRGFQPGGGDRPKGPVRSCGCQAAAKEALDPTFEDRAFWGAETVGWPRSAFLEKL